MAIEPIKPIKDIGSIGKVGVKTGRQKRLDIAIPPLTENATETLENEEEKRIARELGNDTEAMRTAKRIVTLKQRVHGSLPELVVHDYLTRAGRQFVFQKPFDGGRQMRGGLVADFVVADGGHVVVLLVQGEYWHTQFGAKERDRASMLQYVGQYAFGYRIEEVVELWESAIFWDVRRTVESAMAGISVGKR